VAVLAGCGSPTGTDTADTASKPRPVAVAEIEIVTMEASIPDPDYHATCQTGGIVLLKGGTSYDPEGQALTYEWSDIVEDAPSYDFLPRTNPFSTSEPQAGTGLYTIGIHHITLTVTAPDGRKSSTTLHVLVTGCEC